MLYDDVIQVSMTKMVSARVPDELKAEADKYDVDKSEVVREALEAEVRRRRREKLSRRSQDLADELPEDALQSEDIVESIRSDREAEDR